MEVGYMKTIQARWGTPNFDQWAWIRGIEPKCMVLVDGGVTLPVVAVGRALTTEEMYPG